ncbi:hypothetical protein PIROE2DRAFT_9168, partial [Piromyces sp. E2]
SVTQDGRNYRQKPKSLKTSEENSRNIPTVNGRTLSNNRSSSLQQFSKLNSKNSLKDIREPNSHLKKTKSDNQAFQKFFTSSSSTVNSLNSPVTASPTTSKGRKSMFSPNNYSTPILPQTKLFNTSNFNNSSGSTSPFGSSSRQHPGFSNSTSNITSISHVTATPNFLKKSSGSGSGNVFHHYTGPSNNFMSAGPTRANYYNNSNSNNDMDIDVNYQENRRLPNSTGKTFHENVYSNITKKKDNNYMDYMKTKYGKKNN